MTRPPAPNPYKRHRFPAQIISPCVWLSFRFCLGYQDVEELMVEEGDHYEIAVHDLPQALQKQNLRFRPGDAVSLPRIYLPAPYLSSSGLIMVCL